MAIFIIYMNRRPRSEGDENENRGGTKSKDRAKIAL